MGQTSPIPLSPLTDPVSLVTGVEPPTLLLLIPQGVQFYPEFYAAVITMTSSIVGNFCACGAYTTPVLMINTI